MIVIIDEREFAIKPIMDDKPPRAGNLARGISIQVNTGDCV